MVPSAFEGLEERFESLALTILVLRPIDAEVRLDELSPQPKHLIAETFGRVLCLGDECPRAGLASALISAMAKNAISRRMDGCSSEPASSARR